MPGEEEEEEVEEKEKEKEGPVEGEGHQHVVGGGQGEGLHELDDTDGTHQAFKLGSSKLELSWNYLGTILELIENAEKPSSSLLAVALIVIFL